MELIFKISSMLEQAKVRMLTWSFSILYFIVLEESNKSCVEAESGKGA